MAKTGDITYRCNSCEKEDGIESLYWKKEDFHLCFACLSNLFFTHLAPNYKKLEGIEIIRTPISEKLRNELLEEGGNQCAWCKSKDDLQIDHIFPFSLGGKTEKKNLQVLCRSCNQKKGNAKQ